MFKMKTPETQEKYTSKHIDEITDRIVALRVSWLRHVKTQLASQQGRDVLDPAPRRPSNRSTSFTENSARMVLALPHKEL